MSSATTASAVHEDDVRDCIAFLAQVRAHTHARAEAPIKVALQMPDPMLPHARTWCKAIQAACDANGLSARVAVLGDTSFGSCCVDEVAAQHMSADAILHCGHACMSATSSIPAFYVFDRAGVHEDVARRIADHVAERARTDPQAAVLLHWEPAYAHAMPGILRSIGESLGVVRAASDDAAPPRADQPWLVSFASPHPQLFVPSYSRACMPGAPAADDKTGDDVVRVGGLRATLPEAVLQKSEDAVDASTTHGRRAIDPARLSIVHIGSSNTRARVLLARFAGCSIVSIDPETGREDVISNLSSRLLTQRYRCIDALKQAEMVGIVAGTLAVAGRNELIDALRRAAEAAGKRAYVLVVGKLSPTKLGNFSDIDAFVLVGCPENSMLDSSFASSFPKPVATPFEAFVAFEAGPTWTGTIDLEFSRLLASVSPSLGDATACCGSSAPCACTDTAPSEATADASSTALVPSAGGALSAFNSVAAQRFAQRQWRGLEYDVPKDGTGAATTIHEGSTGVASGYSYEPGKR